jgi:lipid A disaccharide synthetase
MLSLEFMIIKHFSRINNCNIIVKALKHSLYADILKDFIAKNKYSNICFHDGKLSETLERCDLAIIDFPSSSILEADAANIPTLVLSYKDLRIRDNALKKYSNIELFKYKNQQEIFTKISKFIKNNS